MKKSRLLLGLLLVSLCASGCDALDNLFPGKQEEEQKQKEKDDDKKEEAVEVKSIVVKDEFADVPVGEYYQIEHDVLPEGANQSVEFESSDDNIAAVYPDGKIYGAGLGNAKVRVTSAVNHDVSTEFDVIVYTTELSVIYNGNGGTGSVVDSNSPYEAGAEVTVLPNGFTRNGYEFVNFNTKADGSGTSYNPGQTFTINDDVTLYAQWNQTAVTTYTLTYNANGGTGSMVDPASPYAANSQVTVLTNAFTKSGYDFVNFNTKANGSGTSYSAGSTFTINSNVVLYAQWEQNSSTDTYYSQCEGLSGSALQSKLKSINPAKNPSYDWSRYEAADEAEDDPTSILCVYTRHNIKKDSHCGSYAWDKWNREHVWTQSKFPASDKDNHNIFACEGQINNYRGNLPFAEGGSVVTVFGHTTGCKMVSGTSFEPCDEAKGEIARSVMYGTVMYSYTMTQEIDSIYLALKWHLQHAITTRETKRNETVYGLQGNRNPFVDHPEYACKIWGNTDANTRSICGM